MQIRWTHHVLSDKLPEMEREFGLALSREEVDDIIHDPQWVERILVPVANRAEKRVQGLPVRVVWRDIEDYHLVITLFVSREPFI